MTARGDELASKIEACVNTLALTLERLDDRAWRHRCAAEGWPIGLVAYHIGRGFDRQAGWIDDMLRGAAPHRFSWTETHELNASVAAAHGPAKDETVRFLREQSGRLCTLARTMTDQQLDTVAALFNQREGTASYVIGRVALGHIEGHGTSIRAELDSLTKPKS